MPSYWSGGLRRSDVNWNTPEYRAYILDKIRQSADEIGEIWVTFDYDFFSLRQEYDDDEDFMGHRQPIYNLFEEPGAIEREMNELIRFFESNGIKISRVLPFTSEDKNSKVNYLNFSSKEKQAAFILYLTELIKIKFKGLENECSC